MCSSLQYLDDILKFLESTTAPNKQSSEDEWPEKREETKECEKKAIETIEGYQTPFYRAKHTQFILKLQDSEESYEFCQTEHLRMQVLYWALCALDLLDEISQISKAKRKELIEFVVQCYDEEIGGFGGNIGHDAHLLNTLSALQVLILLNAFPKALTDHGIKLSKIADFICSLQQKDGSFIGDKWGE
ncbi:hypothetical protein RFI_13209, partial [Reticulomyxa filosa]